MMKKIVRKEILDINSKILNYDQQRFVRCLPQPKPLWKPICVEKLFNVPELKKISEEDQAKLNEEEKDYLNKLRSIRMYLNKEFTVPVLQGGSTIELKEVKEEHQRLIEENNRENERIAKLREERLKKEAEIEELEDLKLKLIENEKYQVDKEKAIRRILKEKERYPKYITKEKLKDAIEQAIDHPTSYEFAIGLNGKILFDKKLHPYALRPSAEPDSSDVITGYKTEKDYVKLEEKKIYHDN